MDTLEYQTSTHSMSQNITNMQDSDGPIAWKEEFEELFNSSVSRYQSGLRGVSHILDAKDVAFLTSIGTNPSEMYDYVEDWSELGEPSFETIFAITSVRYRYFILEQRGM